MSNKKRLAVRNGVDNNNNTIINVTDPVNNQDAATKLYTDTLVAAETARAIAAESGIISHITTKTANYTLTATDDIILVSSGGAITITLPVVASTSVGRTYVIKRLSVSGTSRNVTIAAQSPNTIDGNATVQLTAVNASVTIVTNGANWYII
jgi:hypothetical protein